MPQRSHVHIEDARNHMATTFRFKVSCPAEERRRGEAVLADAHARVAILENELSEYRPSSPVHAFNRAPEGAPVRFTEDAFRLLQLALRIREETGGTFDPFVKGQRPRPGSLVLDPAARTVIRRDPSIHLGFGAIGKGYALDEARVLIERQGFTDFVLSAGGSSTVISGFSAPVGHAWDWAWSWKNADDGSPLGPVFFHSAGQPVALGVSGLQEQGEHLLDPRTGEPARGVSSALYACQSAAWADAMSTALFVGGAEAIGDTPRLAAAVVSWDDCVEWDDGFERLWGSPGAHAKR